jgi:hypothetical protein
MAFAAPIAAEAAEAAGARVAAGAASKGAGKAAPKAVPKGGAPKGGGAPGGGAPKGGGGGKGGGPKGGGGDLPDLPEKGSWSKRGSGKPSGGSKFLKGDAGKSRRMLIAEFIVCILLLGLSPLAKGSGEMGPVRFMKRGTATCAFFVILGLVSSAGKGAAKAASMFGALVTLVLLVDQREAFGKLATVLNAPDDDTASTKGPDDSTDAVAPPSGPGADSGVIQA